MPRKRTHGKRRVDPYSGAEAWKDYFKAGYFLFDDGPDEAGVELDADRQVPRDAALTAWRIYGPAFLAMHGRVDTYRNEPMFALEQFGEPVHAG